MRAAISLLVLLLSMCGVHTESHGTDASTQDVSTELKELRDMVVDLRATVRHTRDDVKVLETENIAMKHTQDEAENVAMKQKLAVSETKIEALERALHDIKAEMEAEMETKVDNLKLRLFVTETEVQNLNKKIRAAPKVAFSAGLGRGYRDFKKSDVNVVFKRVITNVGRAYSSTTGFFTAPVRGVYYFRFTVMDILDSRYMRIKMSKNGQQLMHLYEYDTDRHNTYLSSGLTLQLEKGDVVNMVLPGGSKLWDNPEHHNTFSGFLLFPL